MISLPAFNQGDPQWANKAMSPSKLILGSYGCLVTALSMQAANYSILTNPGELCDNIILNDGFDTDGMLSLNVIEKIYPRMRFWERVYTTNHQGQNVIKVQAPVAVQRIRNLLNMGQPVPISVNLVGHDKLEDHWILATDPDFRACHDPAFGEVADIRARYGEPESAIYGYVAYIGEPISFPECADTRVGGALAQVSESYGKNRDPLLKNAIGILIGQ